MPPNDDLRKTVGEWTCLDMAFWYLCGVLLLTGILCGVITMALLNHGGG